MSGLAHKVGGFFGASTPGAAMSAEDSATEDKIQAALDKTYGTPGTFGQRKISADDAENALRAQGVLPQGWRLRESDSTSSGYRPTQAASKKVALLHAGEVAGAAFGGAAALGAGPLAGLGTAASMGTNAAIQGGLGAAQGAAQGGGWKGALLGGALGAGGAFVPGAGQVGSLKNTLVQGGLGAARGLATGGGLKGALLGGALGAGGAQAGRLAPALTSNTIGQKAVNFGVNTGLNTARTGSFNPLQTAIGAGTTFLPDLSSSVNNPMAQRAINFGGNQALGYAGGGGFNPMQTGLGGISVLNPALGAKLQGILPGRAEGGPVKKDEPVVVGEKGAEVLVPKQDGTVIPNGGVGVGEQQAATGLPGAMPGSAAPAQPNWWDNYGKPLAQVGGIGAGMYFGRQAQQAAMQRSPEELAAINSVMGPGGSAATAASLMQESRPYISKPASYYQTLLNGNRAAMAQAVAPERAALNESYRGAQSEIGRSGVRGAARDVLTGNLARDRAAKVAGLTTGVQPAAANALAGLGAGLQGSAVPLYGSANNFYQQLLQSGLANRTFAAGEGEKTGKQFGSLASQLGNLNLGGKGKTPATGAKKPGTGGAAEPKVPYTESQMPPEFPDDEVASPPPQPPDLGEPDWASLPGAVPAPTYNGSTGDGGNWYDPQG